MMAYHLADRDPRTRDEQRVDRVRAVHHAMRRGR
jgi:hypothetical protein